MHRSRSELKTDTIQSKNDALESPSPLNFITTGSSNLIVSKPKKTLSVNVRIDVKTAALVMDFVSGIMKHSEATSDMNSKLPNLEGDVLLSAKG